MELIQICPLCGSTNIKALNKKKVAPTYQCIDCEHISHIFPEIETKYISYYRNHINKKIIGPPSYTTIGNTFFFTGISILLIAIKNPIPLIIPLILITIGITILFLSIKNEN